MTIECSSIAKTRRRVRGGIAIAFRLLLTRAELTFPRDPSRPPGQGLSAGVGLVPNPAPMTRRHIVHAAFNVISVGLLAVFMSMFLALFFG